MTGFSFTHGAFNVEGSLNAHFQTQLTANGTPAWMPSARVVFDYPQAPLISGHSGHAFSVTHLGSPETIGEFQGRHTIGGSAGRMVSNLMEIDCWVSKEQAGEAWPMRLRQMQDMASRVFLTAVDVQIKNYYTSTASATAIGAVVRVSPVQGLAVGGDPNPDIVRRRMLVRYTWMERV